MTVQSVEMRDIVIPESLQDAMSREAQAAREKQARIILGAGRGGDRAPVRTTASQSYEDNPTALHLRAMNMLYEGLKEKGALMLVPSTAVESMGMGGLLGAAAMRQKSLTDTNKLGEEGFDDRAGDRDLFESSVTRVGFTTETQRTPQGHRDFNFSVPPAVSLYSVVS